MTKPSSNKRTGKFSVLRITVPTVLCVLLFAATLFTYVLPLFEKHLMDQKRELTRQLSLLALETLRSYEKRAAKGEMSIEEAKRSAVRLLREYRFGPEGKDYFWINDLGPTMIMHPYRPDLEGRDVSDFQDPDENRLFMKFVRTVEQSGSGYVDYMWQWKDDPDRVVPKISYVYLFEPWGWIVGTGIYVEDVRAEISRVTRGMVTVCSGIIVITVLLSLYIIRQGRRIEGEKTRAWEALQDSDTRYRDINRELEAGLSEVFDGLTLIAAGDPSVRISEESGIQLISRLKVQVNQTAENLSEIVDLSHEFAIGLAEHFHVLKTVSDGDLSARVKGSGRVELLEALKNVTNHMIESVSLEVNERRQAEEALRRSEQRFREMARLLPTAICEMTQDKTITYINDMGLHMLGYGREDLVSGIHGERLFLQEQLDAIMAGMGTSASPGAAEGIECTLYPKAGPPILALVHYSRMPVEGDAPCVRLSLTDITERKRLEAQLQQSKKMEAIGTLAGGIAHNFNNLLMGIQGYVSLMLLGMESTHPHHAKLKSIEKQIRSGARLTNQLLGYAREGKFEVKTVNLNPLVKETSETLSMMRRDLRIHLDLDNTLFPIRADRGQMEQALLNLCVNASDAMPDGGDLFLKTMNTNHLDIQGKRYEVRPGDYVFLEVRDTGRGMDRQTLERIFEPFFTTKGLSKGTGLGLASVYGIVKAHGGYVDVDSKEGMGTIFEIYLPSAEVEESPEDTTGPITSPLRGAGESILIVDDEETVLEVGSEILRSLGYTVFKARGGGEAVALMEEQKDRIRLVLLDLIMPDMGGGETFDRLKEIKPSVKVLLSSGYSLDGQASVILARGCDGFIQKPYFASELASKLRSLLD